jgi:hypothetical protein
MLKKILHRYQYQPCILDTIFNKRCQSELYVLTVPMIGSPRKMSVLSTSAEKYVMGWI